MILAQRTGTVRLFIVAGITILYAGCGNEGALPNPAASPIAQNPIPGGSGESDSSDPSAGSDSAGSKPETGSAAKTYVGEVIGSDALISLVSKDGQVAAYVCGGEQSYNSMSRRFEGTLENGQILMTDGKSFAAARTQFASALTGTIVGDSAVGTLSDQDGTEYTWTTSQAVRLMGAGLYVSNSGDRVTALVVTNERRTQGISVSRLTGAVSMVTVPDLFDLGKTQVVNVEIQVPIETPAPTETAPDVQPETDTDVEVVVVIDPIDLVEIDLPEPVGIAVKQPEAKFAEIIEIKFRDGLPIQLVKGEPVDLSGKTLNSTEARKLLEAARNGQWYMSHRVDPRGLDKMRQTAEKYWGESLPDLSLYFRLRLVDGMDAEKYRAAFASLKEVEAAYVAPTPVEPPLPPDYSQGIPGDMLDSPLAYQGYLDPASDGGVDARYAWTVPGGRGHKVKLVDIEYGWLDKHQDLPTVEKVNDGDVIDLTTLNMNHGTAVLGIIAGLENGFGVTGIAPQADILFKTPYTNPDDYNVGAALTDSAFATGYGDVILLEQQHSRLIILDGGFCQTSDLINDISDCPVQKVPVEWYKPTYDAI